MAGLAGAAAQNPAEAARNHAVASILKQVIATQPVVRVKLKHALVTLKHVPVQMAELTTPLARNVLPELKTSVEPASLNLATMTTVAALASTQDRPGQKTM